MLFTRREGVSSKYSGNILVGEVEMVAKGIIRKTCSELGTEVIDMAVNSDHMHIFVKYSPKCSIKYITKKDKRKSSEVL
ncbi:MAG: transposase [Methanosarcinaceae archaeon]